jgi:hypothetical protein
MSDYDYDDRPRRRRGTRTREPEYIQTEETYIAKGPGYRQDLVLRQRDDDHDDYRSRASDYPASRRARSHGHRDRDRDSRDGYDDDAYSDYSRSRRRSSRYDDANSYYSEDDRRSRRKSKVGEALEGVGLGGIVAAVTGNARSRSRRRRGSDLDRRSERSNSRSHSRDNRKKWQQAAKAAAAAGIIEAVRSRKDPARIQRVATAALSAAGIDGFLDRDPESKSKRHIIESVVGGLGVNRLANGPRDKSGSRGRSRSRSGSRAGSRAPSVMERLRSRSRSVFGRGRSQSRGPATGGGGAGRTLKELAAVGGVAAVGKAIYDRVRSKSRGRLQRDRSVSSDDSYVPPRRQRYNPRRDNDRSVDDRDDDDDGPRGRSAERDAGGEGQRGNERSRSSSISTTDLENRRRKTRTKELLTAGLATVATIHAAHGVYSSMMASEERRKLVREGEMSPEEARKRKTKNILQDVAAVGIAGLGLKSAYGEWKEMSESRKEKHEIEARHRRHKKAREQRQREEQMRMQQGWGGGGGGMSPQYPDANPYGAYGGYGAIPPPPGAGPPR